GEERAPLALGVEVLDAGESRIGGARTEVQIADDHLPAHARVGVDGEPIRVGRAREQAIAKPAIVKARERKPRGESVVGRATRTGVARATRDPNDGEEEGPQPP